MIFRLFLIHILLWLSSNYVNGFEFVEQLEKWPVTVDSIVNFEINKKYNDKSELFIKVLNSNQDILINKFVSVTKKFYVDSSTDYFVIKKEKVLNGPEKIILKMSFYQLSNGNHLSIEWSENGDKDLIPIYKDKILLKKEWRLVIKVQSLKSDDNKAVYVEDARLFQLGKIVKVSCSAFDGLPQSKVYIKENLINQFKDVSYDQELNQWVGYLRLTVGDHNQNLSCHIQDSYETQVYTLVVNHQTTAVKLSPEYTGYVSNGTIVTCEAVDGFPVPTTRFHFVSASNHSNPQSLYEIMDDKLRIAPSIPKGTELEFNCSAIYTNPLNGSVTVVTRTFGFKVGDQPTNITNMNIAAIAASVTGVVVVLLAVLVVVLLCRGKSSPSRSSSNQLQGSPKYDGSLLAGSKAALRNQVKSHNGSHNPLIMSDSSTAANTDHNELNYDDMPRGRCPIKVVDDPVIYSTIVGTMQPKSRPSLDLGPIDRV